jgi:F0F1-type ATP synthase assembly protein I
MGRFTRVTSSLRDTREALIGVQFMDVVTLAAEQLSGVLAAAVLSLLVSRARIGPLGILVVGLVGGGLGGLILTQYTGTAPVLSSAEPKALAAHIASGAAGGAALALVTGFLTSRRTS